MQRSPAPSFITFMYDQSIFPWISVLYSPILTLTTYFRGPFHPGMVYQMCKCILVSQIDIHRNMAGFVMEGHI